VSYSIKSGCRNHSNHSNKTLSTTHIQTVLKDSKLHYPSACKPPADNNHSKIQSTQHVHQERNHETQSRVEPLRFCYES